MSLVLEDEIQTTAFLSVFEQKLKNLIRRIRNELDKKKKGLPINRSHLKESIREAKKLKKCIKAMRNKNGCDTATIIVVCPHCSKKSTHLINSLDGNISSCD